MKKKILLLMGLFVTALVLAGFLFYPKIESYFYRQKMDEENEAAMKEVAKSIVSKSFSDTLEKKAKSLVPEKAYIDRVPFFCQAPFQNEASWEIHHASCEEAAVLQAVYFYQGVKDVDVKKVDSTLQSMIEWQMKHFGVHKDIHADSVKMMMMGFFGFADDDVKIIRKASLSEIKQWVALGFPVVAPTYGRLLFNPFFKQPGPEYHMVVVIGYTPDRIITNDVGTKRGKDYSYPNEVFRKSMEREGGDAIVLTAGRK